MGGLESARSDHGGRSGEAVSIEHFSVLEDPRQAWKVEYPLAEIMLLVLCATLAGADGFVDIRLWGKTKLDFLRRMLPFNILAILNSS